MARPLSTNTPVSAVAPPPFLNLSPALCRTTLLCSFYIAGSTPCHLPVHSGGSPTHIIFELHETAAHICHSALCTSIHGT